MTLAGVLLVALGGAIGTLARFGVGVIASSLIPARAGTHAFPWGTLAVNLTGCLAIGYLVSAFASGVAWREEYRAAIVVGVLGGFTTFSSFAWETHQLASAGRSSAALAYVLASVVGGIGLAWLGNRLA